MLRRDAQNDDETTSILSPRVYLYKFKGGSWPTVTVLGHPLAP